MVLVAMCLRDYSGNSLRLDHAFRLSELLRTYLSQIRSGTSLYDATIAARDLELDGRSLTVIKHGDVAEQAALSSVARDVLSLKSDLLERIKQCSDPT